MSLNPDDRLNVLLRHLSSNIQDRHTECSDNLIHKKTLLYAEPTLSCGRIGVGGGVASVPTSAGDKTTKGPSPTAVRSVISKRRIDELKWNGWGYRDSQFVVKNQAIHFTGTRYPIGETELPHFMQWVLDTFNVDIDHKMESRPLPAPESLPPSSITPEFEGLLKDTGVDYSVDGIDRLVRSHGQTLHDIYALRLSVFPRIPDVVVWPENHTCVEKVVSLANRLNVVVIPFGGGTSVSGAVTCPEDETRPIISLDTSQMNRILWLDEANLTACCEAGIIGQDLERELRQRGFTTGHEPDSYEFSSLGGWVATRASGMKKNVYGNIEDLLVRVRMVTATGTLEKPAQVPRVSSGPDFNHIVLGSEGTLGVVTEVVLKVRPLPQCSKYGSIVFPDFEAGVNAMREVARQRCQPASIRLMDNAQFRFGQSLRPAASYFGLLLDGLKQAYITRIKGFYANHMCVATLLFEGDARDVEQNEKKIYSVAAQYGGIPAGEKNGKRGYMLTFVIAYIRDLGLEYRVVAESFETSVPWDKTLKLCRNVKHCIAVECRNHKIAYYMTSCRVTQTYDVGCCVYFYFGFNWTGLADPVPVYEAIEKRAREEILACGGSISHHHGVGKLRSAWYAGQVSPLGVGLYTAAKRQLDPNNIFASGNLMSVNKAAL